MQILQRPGGLLTGHGLLVPFGVLLHTTGDGVPADAVAENLSPMDIAVRVYSHQDEGPHFVVDPAGAVMQLRSPVAVSWHAGVKADQRRDFLSGHWETLVPKGLVAWWHDRWPGVKSPSHLYPTASPNESYIGVEFIPAGTYDKSTWKPSPGVHTAPTGGKNRFTTAQYVSGVQLVRTLATSHGLDVHRAGRVLGHEDVNPITRPGWDPGAYQGFWSWDLFWDLYNCNV